MGDIKPLFTFKAFLKCTTAATNQHHNSAQTVARLQTGVEKPMSTDAN